MNSGHELAHREGDGLDVTLVWFGADTLVVFVCDSRNGTCLEIPAEPHRALDVYYHPFAYRHVSTVREVRSARAETHS